jgi:hypothetical protein
MSVAAGGELGDVAAAAAAAVVAAGEVPAAAGPIGGARQLRPSRSTHASRRIRVPALSTPFGGAAVQAAAPADESDGARAPLLGGQQAADGGRTLPSTLSVQSVRVIIEDVDVDDLEDDR